MFFDFLLPETRPLQLKLLLQNLFKYHIHFKYTKFNILPSAETSLQRVGVISTPRFDPFDIQNSNNLHTLDQNMTTPLHTLP